MHIVSNKMGPSLALQNHSTAGLIGIDSGRTAVLHWREQGKPHKTTNQFVFTGQSQSITDKMKRCS